MTRSRPGRGATLAAAAAALGIALAASGQDAKPAATPPPAAEAPALDPDAVEVLKRMVKALTDAKALHVVVDEEYDAIQDDGETLSFGKTSELTMRRPDRFRVEGADRTGTEHVSTYDGKNVTVYVEEKNVFATVARSGDLDSVVAFLRDEVGMKLPIAGLFSPKLRELLLENVTSATYVDEETLDGVDLDHVSFYYGEGIGVQVWVPVKGDGFPRRLVMTFEDARGRPQFRADFREWSTKPDVSDKVFAFSAPAGARSVPFVLPAKTPPVSSGREESR